MITGRLYLCIHTGAMISTDIFMNASNYPGRDKGSFSAGMIYN